MLQDELADGRGVVQDLGVDRALPAHLARFAAGGLRTGFPLAVGVVGDRVLGVADWLSWLASPLGGSSARIVADNLARLERCVASAVAGADRDEADARAVLTAAGGAMAEELALAPGPAAELRAALAEMTARVPEGGRLLVYGRQTSLLLLREAAVSALRDCRNATRERLAHTRAQLAELVAVEQTRRPASRTPEAVRAWLGAGVADAFDPEALAKLVARRRGGRGLRDPELERAHEALNTLTAGRLDAMPALVVCHAGALPAGFDLGASVRVITTPDPLRAAVDAFDQYAGEAARVYAADRVARLLNRWAYDPALHDELVERFSWREMTAQELLALPRVIAVEDSGGLVGERLARLLGLLREARPVHVMVEVQPARSVYEDRLQVDLGALAMVLDRPFVVQSTPARPDHFLASVARAMVCPAPALHVVATGYLEGGDEPAVGAWLAASASVDSRAHPLFRYDPLASGSWAGRLDVDGNPQPEVMWPRHPQTDAPGAAAVAFTLADYALLDPVCHEAFRRGTPEEAARCLPLWEWAALDPEAAFDLLPVIDVVVDGQPQRLVVTTALAAATLARGRRWRLLAEMAGVANAFALRAGEEARAAERAAADTREARLRETHALELDAARREAAGEAMGRLADALLSEDLFDPSVRVATRAPAARGAPAAPGALVPVAVEAPQNGVAVEAADSEEPWIDTPACTTCNDCINLNPLMFAYDGNKQAFIKDPNAGTYAQLVQAAEKCPAKCIHPGKPKAT